MNKVSEFNKCNHLFLDGCLDVLISQVLFFVKLEVVGGNVALLGENVSIEKHEDFSHVVNSS